MELCSFGQKDMGSLELIAPRHILGIHFFLTQKGDAPIHGLTWSFSLPLPAIAGCHSTMNPMGPPRGTKIGEQKHGHFSMKLNQKNKNKWLGEEGKSVIFAKEEKR